MINTKRLNGICYAVMIMSLLASCSARQVASTIGVGAAAGAGIAAVYYAKGDLEADHEKDIESVYKSAMAAVKKRGYTVTSTDLSETSANIKAIIPAKGNEKERDLTIKLERKAENITHISIRVGLFGDEALSRAILDDIV